MAKQRDFEKVMARARRTNAERDAMDRHSGSQCPTDSPAWQLLITAMQAFEASLRMQGDMDCCAEGLVILEVLERRLRPADYKTTQGRYQ